MAVKQIVSDGIGFDAGVIGWLLTQGIGNFSAAAAAAAASGLVSSQQTHFVQPHRTAGSGAMALAATGQPFTITAP